MSHYHHPYHHHTPKKSIPAEAPPSTLQPKVIIMAKINVVVTSIPLGFLSLAFLLVYFRTDILQDYAAKNNHTFTGVLMGNFLEQERHKQWEGLLIQMGQHLAELILALVLVHGAKVRDYGYMKAWLLLMTVGFLAELAMQTMIMSRVKELPLPVILTFGFTDVYRFSCLFVVYLLVDEMLERGEVKRDLHGSQYEI